MHKDDKLVDLGVIHADKNIYIMENFSKNLLKPMAYAFLLYFLFPRKLLH